MRKILFGVVLTLVLLWVFQWFRSCQQQASTLKENTAFIEQQLQQVSKLVVTEGHFSQVLNYQQTEKIFANLLTTKKKALVVVNAKVSVSYDLSQLDYQIDSAQKTVYLTMIPEPELTITPDIEYYDASGDYLNPFNASDINKIKREVNQRLMEKVEASDLKGNAKNRLITELSKLYVLTNSLGWSLVYNEKNWTPVDYLQLTD